MNTEDSPGLIWAVRSYEWDSLLPGLRSVVIRTVMTVGVATSGAVVAAPNPSACEGSP
jgi:hypothetical protein